MEPARIDPGFGQVSRYFFHLRNDYVVTDDEGKELSDANAAIEQAIIYAREMAAESVREGRLNLAHFIEVCAESGQSLCRVTFGEAVRITDGAAV